MARIAHVDDDEKIRTITFRLLKRTKHEISLFKTPEELLELLCAGVQYDIIISDENMGSTHLFGHVFIAEAQKIIRQKSGTTKFILLSSEAPTHTADRFLQKPTDGNTLIATIEELLR
jgi:DNA-binding NtrC family response regulator